MPPIFSFNRRENSSVLATAVGGRQNRQNDKSEILLPDRDSIFLWKIPGNASLAFPSRPSPNNDKSFNTPSAY